VTKPSGVPSGEMRTGGSSARRRRALAGFFGSASTALWQTLNSAPTIGWPSRDGDPSRIALQLFMNDEGGVVIVVRPAVDHARRRLVLRSGSFSGLRASAGAPLAIASVTPRRRSWQDSSNAAPQTCRRHCPASWRPASSWIARADVAREGPDVGDVGHCIRIAVDHVPSWRVSPRRAATGSAP